jgi:diaminopimelate epimerase
VLLTPGNGSVFVRLKMQDIPTVRQLDDDTLVLNTGSPHFVRSEHESIDELDLLEAARRIRYNDEFKEKGINVNFINITGKGSLNIRTYERGVEDETLSCGTGVTAAALSTVVLNALPSGEHTVQVSTKGGELSVRFTYHELQRSFTDVWLQGPATLVYEGDTDLGT